LPCLLSGFMGSSTGSDLHLECSGGPAGEIGYFLVGPNLFDPGVTIGNGAMCLIGQVGDTFYRYNGFGGSANSVGMFDGAGVLQNLVGTSGPAPGLGSGFDVPAEIPDTIPMPISTGEVWHFQVWYRDTPAGVGSSNFSNGLTVGF
ncbi:MAG: hypothetical protein KDB61_06370, partial [Planctomycetes bacterium]|nr:hypothetical protein [Planctomycetota bacterium]